MLVKKELLTIPVGEPPEGEWKGQEAVAVTISKLPRSGRVLSIDIFQREDRRLLCRFFSDAKAYIVFFPAGPYRNGIMPQIIRSMRRIVLFKQSTGKKDGRRRCRGKR